jgi:predicted transcriptional regulator
MSLFKKLLYKPNFFLNRSSINNSGATPTMSQSNPRLDQNGLSFLTQEKEIIRLRNENQKLQREVEELRAQLEPAERFAQQMQQELKQRDRLMNRLAQQLREAIGERRLIRVYSRLLLLAKNGTKKPNVAQGLARTERPQSASINGVLLPHDPCHLKKKMSCQRMASHLRHR